MALKVTYILDGKEKQTYHFNEYGHYIIGRDPDAAIPVSDPVVSSDHCVIIYEEGRSKVRDLASTNGTLVDDTILGGEIQGRKAQKENQDLTVELTPGQRLGGTGGGSVVNETPVFDGSTIKIADNFFRLELHAPQA